MDRVRIDQHVSRVLNTTQTREEQVQKSYTVAHMYSKVGEYDKALQFIDTYLTTYHNEAPAFYLRGIILEKKGKIQEAISAYSESLRLKPKQKDLIAKICDLLCTLDKPPEAVLSHWLDQGRQAGVSPPVIQSLYEKLAVTRGDVQTLERFYTELLKKNPADLVVCKKLINLKLVNKDIKFAKALVDETNNRFSHGAVRPLENLDWIQSCYSVYFRAFTASQAGATPEEGVNPPLEQIILLYGMIDFLSSTFLINISTPDHRDSRDTLRRLDSHLSTLFLSIDKLHIPQTQKISLQIRMYEYFANFCQLCSYMVLKLAHNHVHEPQDLLQLVAVCLSISFSITPPSLQKEAPIERLLHLANKRMCVVGYLLAALIKHKGEDWVQRNVRQKLSAEGVYRIAEVLELEAPQDPQQSHVGPSCLRMLLHMIDLSQVSCAPPSRTHLMRYHESYIRDCYYHLPSLLWLCLAEVTAYDTPPSFPHAFAFSANHFDSFIEESENLTRTDFPSCSRMDIEAFLYLAVFETQYLDAAVNNFPTLLPLVMHSLPVSEARCGFWTSLLTLDEAGSNRKLLIKDASKHKTSVEKGLVPIRCLKRMELPTSVLFRIAEAFEHRLLLCRPDSLEFSEERQRCLATRNELYWGETLRGLDMSEAGVSSLRPDASLSDALAVKLLSLPGSRPREGLGEERSKEIRSRAEMALADLALCKNHVLKAVSLYEKVDLPQAAWNHAQLLKHVALSGDPGILSVSQSRPPSSHDLLLRSHKILFDWTEREALKKVGLLDQFKSELTSLDKSIREHQYASYEEGSPSIQYPKPRARDHQPPPQLNGHSPPFLAQPGDPQSTSSPKTQAAVNADPLSDPTLSVEEKMYHMQLQHERMVLALKQREDVISNLTKKNVELKGIVQNLQFYFTDQKLLFKNPRDPDQAILKPEDLDNLPTPQIPSTVHNLSGRNISLSNSPQYPYNNSASSNKSHNSTHRSILEPTHEEDYINENFLSPANQSNNLSLNPESSSDMSRPIFSLKGRTQPQTSGQDEPSPFANLQLGGNTGRSAPFQIKFPPNTSQQTPIYDFSSSANPPSPPKSSGFSFKGINTPSSHQAETSTDPDMNTSREDYVCTAEYQPLVQLSLIKTETGEEQDEVLFCRRARLFRFKAGEWVEKGIGEMKVLRRRNEQSCRLLMRRDKVMKLCCNHLILPSLEIKAQSNSDKSVTWSTHADFSEDGDPEPLTLAIRFKTAEFKEEFIAAVDKCKQILKETTKFPTDQIPKSSPRMAREMNSSTHRTTPQAPVVATAPLYMGFGPPQVYDFNRQVTNGSDSDGDTAILSCCSDNGAVLQKGPLKIASSSGEQTLFKEQAMLTVNENKQIKNIGNVEIRVMGDADRVVYHIILQKESSTDVFSKHLISAQFDLQPYSGKKTDKAWYWIVDMELTKSKYIVRFSTPAIADKFNQVVQTCIEKIDTSLSNPSAVQSEHEISFSTKPIFGNKFDNTSEFGMEALPGFTFGRQSLGSKGFSTSSGGGSFDSPVQFDQTFEEKIKEERDISQTETSYEADPYFEPVVVLPELKEIKTGEEEEKVVFCQRAKMYRYMNKEWKERGLGELKILSNENTGKYRILMRRDVIKKLCCNHYITCDMKLKKNQTSEKVWIWHTLADFSEETPRSEQLAVRFRTVEFVEEFRIAFEKCQSYLNGEPKPKSEPTVSSIPNEGGEFDDSNEHKSSEAPITEDVIVVSVTHPTEEQVRRARELLLPDGFYLYEEKPACPGCRGCDEDFCIKYQGEVKSENAELSPSDNQASSSHTQTPPKSGAIFGGNIGNLSFSSLVKAPSSGAFQGSTGGNSFSKYAKPLFRQDKEGDLDTSDPDPDSQFKPLVELAQLEEIKTGEEEEEVVLTLRAKLYRFTHSEWKERGIGEMKILHNPATGKYRLLMRRDQVKKICCNHYITSLMELSFLQNSDRSLIWQTLADFTEETPQSERLAIRFKTAEIAEEFRTAFEKCQEEIMNRTLRPHSNPSTDPIPEGEEVESQILPDSNPKILSESSSSDEKDVENNEQEPPDEVTAAESSEENKQRSEPTISSEEKDNLKEESDDDIIYVSSAEPTIEQIMMAEKYKLPKYFYLYEDKPPCRGCPGCDEDFEIVYESERVGTTDSVDSHIIAELRDASEDTAESSKGKDALKGSFFGPKIEGGESFTDLARSDDSQGFASGGGNPFKAYAKPLFAHSQKGEGSSQEYDPDADFKPVMELPELQDFETGEEEEEVIVSNQCKLLRYVDKEWKERGKGDIKILHNPNTDRYRIVMRRDIIKKVCCNHYITAEMKIEVHDGQEKNLIWRSNADFSEENHRAETLVAAFRKVEMAKEFMDAFNECVAAVQTPGTRSN